jgi:hypothetical protein
VRLDERKSAGSGITRRAIRRSDRHRGWLRSNFIARERQEADHRPHHAKHLGNVAYNRGILNAAIHVEAIRNAQGEWRAEADGTGREEWLRTVPRLHFGRPRPAASDYRADHEGGGWVQIFQVHDGKFVKETDWFRGYPEVVAAAVKKAE